MDIKGKLGSLWDTLCTAYCALLTFKEDEKTFCLKRLVSDPALMEMYSFCTKTVPVQTIDSGGWSSLTQTVKVESKYLYSEDPEMQTICAQIEFEVKQKVRLAATNFLKYSRTSDARRDWRKSKMDKKLYCFEKFPFQAQEWLGEVTGVSVKSDEDEESSSDESGEDDEDSSSSSDESD